MANKAILFRLDDEQHKLAESKRQELKSSSGKVISWSEMAKSAFVEKYMKPTL